MESEEPGGTAALSWTESGWPEARGKPAADSAPTAVAALYQHHAVGLIRLAYLMLGDRAGAEAAVLGLEERQEVMRAVRQLPARQREALVLRFYLDLPEREIARLMGLRPSSVRSAIARALKALGHALGEPS